jgi:hypothetical protein
MTGTVFLDHDGCLGSFDRLMMDIMRGRGEHTPTDEQLDTRRHDYLSQAFPSMFTKEQEMALCDEVFKSGLIRTQAPYPQLDRAAVGRALRHPDLVMLTKIPDGTWQDRVQCLSHFFGVDRCDIEKRFISIWGSETKGHAMLTDLVEEIPETGPCDGIDERIAKAMDTRMPRCWLVDDRPDNLESAMVLGASGMLVLQSYNRHQVGGLRSKYGSRFRVVTVFGLGRALCDLLEEVTAC